VVAWAVASRAVAVPFPQTVPDGAPRGPGTEPLLDQRAARVLFARRRLDGATGYRLSAQGVTVTGPDYGERFVLWSEVRAQVDRIYARPTSADPEDPSRRERRQARRREGLERGDDS
jgi:hypothetical protein